VDCSCIRQTSSLTPSRTPRKRGARFPICLPPLSLCSRSHTNLQDALGDDLSNDVDTITPRPLWLVKAHALVIHTAGRHSGLANPEELDRGVNKHVVKRRDRGCPGLTTRRLVPKLEEGVRTLALPERENNVAPAPFPAIWSLDAKRCAVFYADKARCGE
jgi:hypothetical protein